MIDESLRKDYTFAEWIKLDESVKADVFGKYWSVYEPKKGRKTRDAIVRAFKKAFPDIVSKAYAIGFFPFGHFAPDFNLYVVVKDSKIRVPGEFAWIPVYKGIIKEEYKDNKYKINFINEGYKIWTLRNKKTRKKR